MREWPVYGDWDGVHVTPQQLIADSLMDSTPEPTPPRNQDNAKEASGGKGGTEHGCGSVGKGLDNRYILSP